MNRNTNAHFANVPTIEKPRSSWPMVQNIRTTFNTGSIIPFYVDLDGLPGDTFKYNFTFVLRGSTPLNPTMDNAYIDFYWFKIPWRILWTHCKNFFGENTFSEWYETTEYEVPQIETPSGGWNKGTIANYMGLPIGRGTPTVSALAFRAYTMIYNYFFRDQNLIAPATEYTDDNTRTGSNTTTELGGVPFKAAKFHDYFTSCLPGPQKGPSVTLPLGTSAPVIGNGMSLGLTNGTNNFGMFTYASGALDNAQVGDTTLYGKNVGTASGGTVPSTKSVGIGVTTDSENSGLIADLSNAVAATLNSLRIAGGVQRIYEAWARGGSRMNETVQMFGTQMPDSRYQIPEYLGGKRYPINISTVLQTSAQQSNGTPLGDTGAMSLTVDSDDQFTTSLTEWSVIMGLAVVRTDHSYGQGVNRQWTRRRMLDLYWPQLCYIGEQPVYNYEIYSQGSSVVDTSGNVVDEQVFGYQEAWASYRYKPSINTGAFSVDYNQSLSVWHYGDKYNSLPVLSQQWLEETVDNVDRTLAVTSATEDQWLMDSLTTIQASRVMALYSVPGLFDHY